MCVLRCSLSCKECRAHLSVNNKHFIVIFNTASLPLLLLQQERGMVGKEKKNEGKVKIKKQHRIRPTAMQRTPSFFFSFCSCQEWEAAVQSPQCLPTESFVKGTRSICLFLAASLFSFITIKIPTVYKDSLPPLNFTTHTSTRQTIIQPCE